MESEENVKSPLWAVTAYFEEPPQFSLKHCAKLLLGLTIP